LHNQFKAFSGRFNWVLERDEAERGGRQILRLKNEGIAQGDFEAKTAQKSGTFWRFFGKIGTKKALLEGGFR
jgi:hypothetical protein